MNKEDYVWYDRKRYFGLPISFTKYYINEDRFFLETGFLTTNIDEILLYRIRDISVKITLGQKIFGVGSITLTSSDKTNPVIELKNIKNPRKVKEIFHENVEAMKDKKRMRVGEILEDEEINPDNDDYMDEDDYSMN